MSESTNPKDAIGRSKPPLHLIPPAALIIESIAFRVGATKYGPYNWRDNTVAASVYVGAALRHLLSWFDGEDIDSESKVSHLGHARACLAIILDATEAGKLVDDRPTPGNAAALIKRLTATPVGANGDGGVMQDGKTPPRKSEDMQTMRTLGLPPDIARLIVAGTTYCDRPTEGMAYIAGPMRGYADFNFPAFDAARDFLSRKGLDVISPADIDRAAGDENSGSQHRFAFRDFLALYFLRAGLPDGMGYIAMLPGWENSVGAVAEFFVARWLGLRIVDAFTGEPLSRIDGMALILSFKDMAGVTVGRRR